MANVWDFLDGVATQAGTVLSERERTDQVAARAQTEAPAKPIASAQGAASLPPTWLYVALAAAVIVSAVLILRR